MGQFLGWAEFPALFHAFTLAQSIRIQPPLFLRTAPSRPRIRLELQAIALLCGPVGVPNHAPVPLLALYLKARPALIVSAEAARAEGRQMQEGTYVDPASIEVERAYVLDPKDPHAVVSIPPGFTEVRSNRSWLIFEHCA